MSGHNLDILVSDGVQNVRGGQVELFEPVRVQPNAHAVLTGAEDSHLTDARQPGQGILHIDDAVVGEEGLIEPVVVRVQADYKQDIGGDLPDGNALDLDAPGKLGERAVHLVLDEDERFIEVGAHIEGDRECISPVAPARGRHVNRLFDAIDRLFDGHSDRVRNDCRAGARVSGAHLNRRGRNRRILLLRQSIVTDESDNDSDEGKDIGKDRPLDEEP